MADVQSLKIWFRRFLEHKDMMLRRIMAIEELGDGFRVRMKDRELVVRVVLRLRDALPIADGWVTVATLHNAENGKILLDSWAALSQKPRLTLYFVNPYSARETKWVIVPATHHQVCDPESLALGIAAMGELVDEIPEQEFRNR